MAAAIIVLVLASASASSAADLGLFSPADSLHSPRQNHMAALLSDGTVLVVGGTSDARSAEPVRSCELFHPPVAGGDGTWTLAADFPDSVAVPISGTATTLADGTVLVAGGVNLGNELSNVTAVYNGQRDLWTVQGSLSYPRMAHTATLLSSGFVLVAGGFSDALHEVTSTAELYDPVSGLWSLSGELALPRAYHGAGLLLDDEVIVVGGSTLAGVTAETEIYNVVRGVWATVGPLNFARQSFGFIVTTDGRPIVAGGFVTGTNGLTSAEEYNADTFAWTVIAEAALSTGVGFGCLVEVSSLVVSIGGFVSNLAETVDLADVYYLPNPGESWLWAPNDDVLVYARAYATCVTLQDGRALVIGGQYTDKTYMNGTYTTTLSSAEFFTPISQEVPTTEAPTIPATGTPPTLPPTDVPTPTSSPDNGNLGLTIIISAAISVFIVFVIILLGVFYIRRHSAYDDAETKPLFVSSDNEPVEPPA